MGYIFSTYRQLWVINKPTKNSWTNLWLAPKVCLGAQELQVGQHLGAGSFGCVFEVAKRGTSEDPGTRLALDRVSQAQDWTMYHIDVYLCMMEYKYNHAYIYICIYIYIFIHVHVLIYIYIYMYIYIYKNVHIHISFFPEWWWAFQPLSGLSISSSVGPFQTQEGSRSIARFQYQRARG